MQLLNGVALADIAGRWPSDELTSVDYETTGDSPASPGARIVGLSMVTGDDTPISIPLSFRTGQNADPATLEVILSILSQRRLLAFFVPMEAAWTWQHWKLHANWAADAFLTCVLTGHGGGLKALVPELLQRDVITFQHLMGERTDFSLLHPQDPSVIAYMEADSVNARDLQRRQAPLVTATTQAILDDELRAAVILAEAWAGGIDVDERTIDVEQRRLTTETGEAERDVFAILGGGPFTLASPVQLGKRLTALGLTSPLRTATDNPSWSGEALELLQRAHPVVPRILEWRDRFTAMNAVQRSRKSIVGGKVFPEWFPIDSRNGHSRANCQGLPLTTLHHDVRSAFPAPAGTKWFKVSWGPRAEIWFMLGWLHPQLVADSLAQWNESAEVLGVTPDQLHRLAVAWALGNASNVTDYMARKVPDAPLLSIEAADLAFAHTWAILDQNIQHALWSTIPVTTGVHTRAWPEADSYPLPTEDAPVEYVTNRRKHFLASVCQLHEWSLTKRLMVDLRAAGIGAHYIPIADTLSFISGKPQEVVEDFIEHWAHPYRPPSGPVLTVGSTWGEV